MVDFCPPRMPDMPGNAIPRSSFPGVIVGRDQHSVTAKPIRESTCNSDHSGIAPFRTVATRLPPPNLHGGAHAREEPIL